MLTPGSRLVFITCTFTEKLPEADTELCRSRLTLRPPTGLLSGRRRCGRFLEVHDERAAELERRVVLSQYLMAIQSAGIYPPQETGLTYNSWYGKFHIEITGGMPVHFALWNRNGATGRERMDWYALPPEG